uniref:Uncharacterized protein n=1 Tax=Arundo donax TaxID=35708 RepID=A0A0A8Y7D3_ARUDO
MVVQYRSLSQGKEQITRHQIKLVHQQHQFVKLGEEEETKAKVYQFKTHALIGMRARVQISVAISPSSSSSGGRRLTAGSRRRTRRRRPRARRRRRVRQRRTCWWGPGPEPPRRRPRLPRRR